MIRKKFRTKENPFALTDDYKLDTRFKVYNDLNKKANAKDEKKALKKKKKPNA